MNRLESPLSVNSSNAIGVSAYDRIRAYNATNGLDVRSENAYIMRTPQQISRAELAAISNEDLSTEISRLDMGLKMVGANPPPAV